MERLQLRKRSQEKWQKVEVTWWWTGFGSCVIWPLSDAVPEDLRSPVIVPLHKGKGDD